MYNWVAVLHCLLRVRRGAGTGEPYMKLWIARAWLLSAMAAEGVERLVGVRAMTVQDFSMAFPDSKGWFSWLGSPDMALDNFFALLGYTGRPEFFSMFTCLLLTAELRVNPAWTRHFAGDLKRCMGDYASAHGLPKLPSLCVAELVKASKRAKA